MSTLIPLQRFEAHPADYVNPERVYEFLPDIPVALAKSMLARPRFSSRLSRVIGGRYSLDALLEREPSEDLAIARLQLDDLTKVQHLAGAIYHREELRTQISKDVLAELLEGLGGWGYRVAVEYTAAHPVSELQDTGPIKLTKADLVEDGGRCFIAWLRSLHPQLANRVQLRFPRDFDLNAVPLGLIEIGADMTRTAGAAVLLNRNEETR